MEMMMMMVVMIVMMVWCVEYDDEICNDDRLTVDINDGVDLQSLEPTPQLNHVYNKANGDLENDIDAIKATKPHSPVVQRQSSVGSAAIGPVNGLKTYEHNIILQRMAIVEVKKPGKGGFFCTRETML